MCSFRISGGFCIRAVIRLHLRCLFRGCKSLFNKLFSIQLFSIQKVIAIIGLVELPHTVVRVNTISQVTVEDPAFCT